VHIDNVVTAHVRQAAPDLDMDQLHRFVVAALPRYPLAIAPHVYRIYSARPEHPDDPHAWNDAHLVAVGTGRA
jgi:hypothetical protein